MQALDFSDRPPRTRKPATRLVFPLGLTVAITSAALAGPQSDHYIDDRSSPERVIISLYNAVNRQEYLRAWSYFNPETGPPLATFTEGYTGTAQVELRTEGAAGSIHAMVPLVLKATDTDGSRKVFTGCYHLTQVQPAAQTTLPFRPILIDDGRLEESDTPFPEAMGQCDTP
ncbi:hypothetical protein SAMN04489859_105810 [Paracoccus alcaliphilus]|uniref:Uncharacterized protein n=1 Tax=Paracoccus alcaliphilus TaxID=34002 RepID=A0A1H8NEG9_9RHOB|nr:hypothetical protein [Paracoccus alcaliphilus]WCR18757.1 hypothetical protein JHW40_03295 [Paracoccus alcaliphilus]SEO28005.1 hypothetical protein SAMN04489859_105810 [Paracoccus alcaliphilus]